MEITIENTEGLAAAARQFVEAMGERRIFAFYGKMGAGKTTFIKAICEALGVEDVVTSPTFAIVNEYGADGAFDRVYHFDFYRIKNLREAYDIGCEEYFYSGCPCFIEWPELVEELLPENTVNVSIEVRDDESRLVKIA
ncbi:MAG: tRNA (adenosine(37)-N6)-threonylcarbamoyltransferase complex ATPase subunit type 1 TsaE [Bacteroidaceae bacterium]|nr:tRNA (adenosine(37)-N6)-threonylcarbamoyltransferase complex ATPase subunit type 1 TsaE [Bacteroidaceae bacterium]